MLFTRLRALPLVLALVVARADAEDPPAEAPVETSKAFEETITPTYETQKLARTYVLGIPAPRGQITDRNGVPLAQNKLSYNLAINYPSLDFTDEQTLKFAHDKIQAASDLLKRPLNISDDLILRHYRNRGILPFEVAQNLSKSELAAVKDRLPEAVTLRPIYMRTYPNGALAGHILGYAGKTGRNPDGIIENGEVLWPETEGRDGLEQTFNEMLTGQHGQYKITFDREGRKTSEKIIAPPIPGNNVVTTLDAHLQELAEKALEAKAKRGAIVILDPNNGDILAMASWPCYNPNAFTPTISAEKFKALQDDPDIPLLPRAFRSSYPPGSTFKVAVGIAALESGTITTEDSFECPAAMEVGNLTFHNWKKSDRGSLNFVQALTESCDTWFYQVGIKTGAQPIIDWALKLGFGARCGLPLRGEVEGRIPNDEYMKATHGRRILDGDVANLSIGQGDTQVTPLQMAQAMAIIANRGTMYQTRLVQQVQTVDNQIVTAYQVRAKKTLGISAGTIEQLHEGMVDVVNTPAGTAHQAALENVEVAGKTGTAQWGPKNKERTAAWFSGFVPSENAQYAFAALYEGEVGSKVHGGTAAAPMIGKILKEVYKTAKTESAGKTRHRRAAEADETTDKPAPENSDNSD